MNMMNKCAKFHEDSPSDKKVKFNLPSAIELAETAVFVYNFLQKPYASEQLRWHIWPIFPLNFLIKFSQKMPLYFFYTMVQKVKNDQKLKSRGPALNSRRGRPHFLPFTEIASGCGKKTHKAQSAWRRGARSNRDSFATSALNGEVRGI